MDALLVERWRRRDRADGNRPGGQRTRRSIDVAESNPSCTASLIDDDPGGFPEIRQSFFLGDGLGIFRFHAGNNREHDETAFLSRNDKILRKARTTGIFTR